MSFAPSASAPRASPSFVGALISLATPLLLRPLVWAGACALLGVVLGGELARTWSGLAREEAPLWLLLPFLIGGLSWGWFFRRNAWGARAGIAVAVVAFFAGHSARRLLAPRADVSRLFLAAPDRSQPLHAAPVHLVGIIGDYPQKSRWTVWFPLDVEQVEGKSASGRMWVSAPFDSRLEVGDRIELRTDVRALRRPSNPGEREAFWSQIGAGCWCESGVIVELRVEKPGVAHGLERAIQNVRRGLLGRYEALFVGDEGTLYNRPFPRQNAALLTAMVWGESGLTEPLPQQTRDDFRAAGLSHLLVASGSQISFCAVGLLFLARWLGVKRGWLVFFIVPGLMAYSLVAGAAPSIWRATEFGVLGALCLGSGRDLDSLSVWSAALMGLLLLDPAQAWSLSLQFSFAAVWGLIVVAPVAFQLLRRVHSGGLVQLASMSLGAQAATWPLSLLHFGTSSIAGLGANFLAVPLAGVLVFAGALGLVVPWGEPLYRLTGAVGAVAAGAAHPAGALVEGVSLPLGWVWAVYLGLAMAALPLAEQWDELREAAQQWFQKQWGRVVGLDPRMMCGLLAVVAVGITANAQWPSPRTLRVTVLDVGQGQCVVIQDPSGRAALVDGGSLDGRERADIGAAVIVPALKNLGVSRLDYVFLTSPEDEHCNGLKRVLREVPVGAFVDGPRAGEKVNAPLWNQLGEAELLNLRREVERLGVPVIVPKADDVFPLGETGLRVLNPLLPLAGSQNDNLVVLRAEWKNKAVLLSGDVEGEGEKRLVHSAASLKCDVLLVSQHGSITSSSPEWLRASAPGVALVSCGRFNRLNDPAPAVLQEFSARKIPVFRTDLDGALGVECDESACRITPQNP